jgi:hypothetical protein
MSTSGYDLRNLLKEKEDDNGYGNEDKEFKDGQWLITPLPLITTSQRSIVDNGIENLLIEHPSMSVFIKATNEVRNLYNSSSSLSLSFSLALSLLNLLPSSSS